MFLSCKVKTEEMIALSSENCVLKGESMTPTKVILASLIFSLSLHAKDSSDQERKEAYKATQEMMKDKKQRTEVIEKSPNAKKSDQFVDKVVQGDEKKKDEMYKLSADILGNYSSKDPAEMEKILSAATKDPKGFFDSLTPEQKRAVQEMAKSIEASNTTSVDKP